MTFRTPTDRSATPTTRRLDIQGLRAIAVVGVIVNHVTGWPVGGFLGVDVFFVISGFLITGLMLREKERTGRISLVDFYRRRLRRIAPLAVLVLVTTVAASFAILSAARAKGVLTDSLWAAALLSNRRFADVGTDYFLAAGPVSPLQHFWSLAVEEQFYLVWPVVLIVALFAATRRGRQAPRVALTIFVSVAIVASFLYAIALTGGQATVAYFSTPARAWELGIGVFLALTQGLWQRIPGRIAGYLSWLGLAAIVGSFLFVDESFGIPGPWSASAVLATALVIAAGSSSGSRVPVVLGNPVSQYLGAVSYSLYLWHFPILIFATEVVGDDLRTLAPTAVILSLAAASASYHLVERPVLSSPWLTRKPASGHERRRGWSDWRRETVPRLKYAGIFSLTGLTALVTVASIASGTAGSASYSTPPVLAGPKDAVTDGGAQKSSQVDKLQSQIRASLGATTWPRETNPSIESVADGTATITTHSKCGALDDSRPALPECTFGDSTSSKTAVLVGDSNAMAYLDGLISVAKTGGWKLEALAAYGCRFVDLDFKRNSANESATCRQHNDDALEHITATKPDLVIVTNLFAETLLQDGSPLTADALASGITPYLARVTKAGSKVVSLSAPPADKNPRECYKSNAGPASCVSAVQPIWRSLFGAEKSAVMKVGGSIIDSRPLLCANDFCPLFVGDTVVRADTTHISVAYAEKIAPALQELFADLGYFVKDEPAGAAGDHA